MKLALTISLVGLMALSSCSPPMVTLADGTKILPNGSKILPDGTEIVPVPGSTDTSIDDSSTDEAPAASPTAATEIPAIAPQAQAPTELSKSDGKVRRYLYGFGKLRFGFSVNEAFSVDPTLELITENSFTFLGTVTSIDGISFVERVFFSGTPAKMSYVNLQCISTEDATKKIVIDLTKKYGEPKVSESSIIPGDDSYEWYFLNGATISMSDGLVSYDSPQEPLPSNNF